MSQLGVYAARLYRVSRSFKSNSPRNTRPVPPYPRSCLSMRSRDESQQLSSFAHDGSSIEREAEITRSQIVAPYGMWNSLITADLLAGERVSLDSPKTAPNGKKYYLEGRSTGTNCIVEVDGSRIRDVLPDAYSARSAVHEYGGAAYALTPSSDIVFTDMKSKKVLLLDPASKEVRCILQKQNCRYADFEPHPSAPWIIAIEEDHTEPAPSKVKNRLVVLDTSTGETETLVEGADFYTSPRFSPDGRSLCWLQWDHPDMPWTGAQVYVADITPSGKIEHVKHLAGKASKESAAEPRWSPNGDLFFLCDTSGYYEFAYVKSGDWRSQSREDIIPVRLELHGRLSFGGPEWILGNHTYVFLRSDHIIAVSTVEGANKLVSIRLPQASWETVEGPWSNIGRDCLTRVSEMAFLLIGSGTDSPDALYLVNVHEGSDHENGTLKAFNTMLKSSLNTELPGTTFSFPEHVTVEGGQSAKTYGFFFPPQNPSYKAPENSLPPLIILSHGGPTSHFGPGLALQTQFWTSRGYAVFCLNYRGSSGYGRAYIEELDGNWGIADVADAVACVRFLGDRIDTSRVGIRGGSAGGYCVLQALCDEETNSTWAGGVSAYGISDLHGLVEDTHKFESKYMDRLLFRHGLSESEKEQVLRDRSAVSHPERIRSPLLLLQGTDDKVVPPEQSKRIEQGARETGADVRLVMFDGEGHGFRIKKNVEKALIEEEKWWQKTLVRE